MKTDFSEAQDIQLAVLDESKLPELIQGQIGKLKDLDDSVQKALAAATQAEKRAKAAGELSAGWSLFGGRKKDAIEGLQEAGLELAGAVQSGAEAQRLSFEFQTRLGDVTKYLFGLGVGSIAANRAVVRELELRLSGASEEQLSELARDEVASVVRQLKEQEDMLRKQEQMKGTLREQDLKIRHLLDRTDDLGLALNEQTGRHRDSVSRIDAMAQVAESQGQGISILHHQVLANQSGLGAVLARSENLELKLEQQNSRNRELESVVDFIAQASKRHEETILMLQQEVLAQKSGYERLIASFDQSQSAQKVRTALLVGLATILPAAAYFLR